jgi:hypothetical protein
MAGAKVILVSDAGEEQVITHGLDRMVLQLDLQQSYLLSIERPGCISKQLVFNTTVPELLHS